jgi:F-type H+-transporting ATPase subunit delta
LSRVAKRYAKALFQVAIEQNVLDNVKTDFEQVKSLLVESDEFKNFLENPLISEFEKSKVITALFKNKFSDLTYDFLQLLTKKKRSSILPDAAEEFNQLLLEHRNFVKGDLISAVDLSDEQTSKIKSNIEEATGKSVILKQHLDPKIIGGFIVKIEDIIIDNSIRFQLNKLRERLVAQ